MIIDDEMFYLGEENFASNFEDLCSTDMKNGE